MKILSIYFSMPSSVSLFLDDRVFAATHEERFTRIKNDEVFPSESIHYCLKEAGLQPKDLDGVAVASFQSDFGSRVCRRSQWAPTDYLKEQRLRWKPVLVDKTLTHPPSIIELFPEKVDLNHYPKEYWQSVVGASDCEQRYAKDRSRIIADFLEISQEKVFQIEHHRAHAAYSYYASPFRNEPVLALTADGYGDGVNATAGIFDTKGIYKRHFSTNQCAIARVYRYMTLLLGMKPNEHEYKVMGLAPYGSSRHGEKAANVFRSTLYVDGLEFKWREKPADSYYWFKERLEGMRFDHIAWGLQTWVEELLLQWVENCVNHFRIKNVVFSGGVAMNIKAMGKIAALPSISKFFVGGSASDESLSISSGICLAEDLNVSLGNSWDSSIVKPIEKLYLGPAAKIEDEKIALNKLPSNSFLVTEKPNSKEIAQLLAEGKILARCTGRMEFGQRSLGNRSILADPSLYSVKDKINAAIKSRDFWMPFAPVVLDSYSDRYLVNPKRLESPHMTIGFETTAEGYSAMFSACHPADKTARAQILRRDANPELYDILEKFADITGRGALLNTSFNLHGHPIVNTPEDAIHVLINCQLDGLILNNFLVLRKG